MSATASSSSSQPSIPATVADVTPEWMTSVLQGSGAIGADTQVAGLNRTQIGQGVGLMGELFVTEMTYSGEATGAPASVVVKLPAGTEENRAQGIALGMYDAECRFYAEMGEATGTGLPDIHLSAIVPGTAEFVIVMEDLSSLELVSQADGMSLEQAGAAVRVLADVHTAWWGKVQTDDLDWIPSLKAGRIEFVDQVLPTFWPKFEELFGDHLPEGGAEFGAEWSSRYLELMTVLADRSPWTLLHQDYRVENILFGDPATDEVVVIDWQGLGRGPASYDVAYILGGSMDLDLRREHEEALVAEYHARLVANGIADYSFETCWNDYRYSMLLGGLAVAVFAGGTLDLSNERGFELVATMAKRAFTAALDHGGFDLLTTT